MKFKWIKYDEISDEYVCHHYDINAYVYRAPHTRVWAWLVSQKGVKQGGQTNCASDAFDMVEQILTIHNMINERLL